MQEHTIDAENRAPGRVASEAARILMGKHDPSFVKNEVAKVRVKITNASRVTIDPKKQDQKVYMSYSGHPGGRTDRTMRKIIADKGHSEVVRRAVYGMLPVNRLRAKIMKNLDIQE